MKKLGIVKFKGKSGNHYKFDAYPLQAVLDSGVAGVFVVTERKRRKTGTGFVHSRLTTGQSLDLGASLTGGEKAYAEKGANCFCVHPLDDQDARSAIEKDLTRKSATA